MLQFALKKILDKTWPLLNTLQIVSMIIIICATFVPANVTNFNSAYNSVINFKLVPQEIVDGWVSDFKVNTLGLSSSQNSTLNETNPVSSTEQEQSGETQFQDSQMESMLKDIGTSNDDVATNFIIFCISLGLVTILILILICLRKALFSKLPKFVQNQITNIGNMLRYNAVLRYLIQAYMNLFLGALIVVKTPGESSSGITIAMSSFQLLILIGFVVF
jgi:hypothetical protein